MDPDGVLLAEHAHDALVGMFNRGRKRIETDFAKAVDAGRLFEVDAWVRASVGAELGDLVFMVAEHVLAQVQVWEKSAALALAEDEARQRLALRGWAA